MNQELLSFIQKYLQPTADGMRFIQMVLVDEDISGDLEKMLSNLEVARNIVSASDYKDLGLFREQIGLLLGKGEPVFVLLNSSALDGSIYSGMKNWRNGSGFGMIRSERHGQKNKQNDSKLFLIMKIDKDKPKQKERADLADFVLDLRGV